LQQQALRVLRLAGAFGALAMPRQYWRLPPSSTCIQDRSQPRTGCWHSGSSWRAGCHSVPRRLSR